MRQPAIGLAAVLLLATNPYLLEFFALSRGYGLAVALVTAGGWCLARWCEGARDAPSAERWLAAALGLSAAAVAASYAALVAFVAVCGVVVARTAWAARRRPGPAAGRPAPLWGARAVAVLALVTVIFSVGVYSRERQLVPGHPVPVTVGVAGLYEEELIDLRVFRADVTGRLREVPRSARRALGSERRQRGLGPAARGAAGRRRRQPVGARCDRRRRAPPPRSAPPGIVDALRRRRVTGCSATSATSPGVSTPPIAARPGATAWACRWRSAC